MRKRWRWFWRSVAGLFVLAIVLLVLDYALAARWRRIPIGLSTTRITGPLASDGLPDYLKAINDQYGKGVTAENNAAPAVLAVVGLRGKPAWKATVLRVLQIPDPGDGTLTVYEVWARGHSPQTTNGATDSASAHAPTLNFVDPEAPVEEAEARPWQSADSPEVAAYLASQSAALDALERAVERDHFYQPLVTEDGELETHTRPAMESALLAPEGFNVRRAARVLAARSMLRAGEHDAAGFTRDITALARLGRLIAQGPSLIDYLAGIPIQSLANSLIQTAATMPDFDPAAIAALRNLLTASGPTPTPARQLDVGERYMMLDALCTLSDAASSSTAGGGAYPPLPIDFPAGMIEANDFYDRLRDTFALPSYTARQSTAQACAAQMDAIAHAGRWHKLTHMQEAVLPIVAPAITRVNVFYTRAVADEHLATTALALRLYRGGHAEFPATLAESGVKGEETLDPFTGKPLIYRRVGTGYVLYSVGDDLEDNGGTPRGPAHVIRGWDIVVRAER